MIGWSLAHTDHKGRFIIYGDNAQLTFQMETSESESFKVSGNERFREKNFHEAKRLYTEALSIDSTNPVLYANRCACNLNLQHYEEAEQDARMSLAIDHTSSKLYYRLAKSLKFQNKILDALEVIDLGLKVANISSLRNLRADCIRELYTPEIISNVSVKGTNSLKAEQSNKCNTDVSLLSCNTKCMRCASSPNLDCLQCSGSKNSIADIERRIRIRVQEVLTSLRSGNFHTQRFPNSLNDKQSILKQLLDPQLFKSLIFPGLANEDALYLPTSLKELLEWPSLRIDPDTICLSAVDVYNGVVSRGKSLGQDVDASTQVMLISDISQEATARSIIEASREVCRLVNAVHARMAIPIAAPKSQIVTPLLDDGVTECLVKSGVAVQDEFLGFEWSDLVLKDVQRFSANEIMSPSTIEGVDHYNNSSHRPKFSWLDLTKLSTQYPALHSALTQLYQLPFEINDKSSMLYEILEIGKGCSMLVHYPISSYQNSRLDSAVSSRDKRFHNSFRISCSYNIVPSAAKVHSGECNPCDAVTDQHASSLIYSKPHEKDSTTLPIKHDQLIMHLSRDVKNSRLEAVEGYYSILVFMHGKK